MAGVSPYSRVAVARCNGGVDATGALMLRAGEFCYVMQLNENNDDLQSRQKELKKKEEQSGVDPMNSAFIQTEKVRRESTLHHSLELQE
eukprot:9503959-Pyramimonas_sp.AAC.3